MTFSDPSRPYHHGHLRRALLDAALQVLTEEGLAGLTLRAVARRAGVSEAAPYHHFSSKSALVEALVRETLQQLAQALQEATQATEGTPLDRLVAVGVAYVCFALEHRASFHILYRPELRDLSRPVPDADGIIRSPIDRAGMAAYQVLLDAIVACQQVGEVVPGDPLPLALTAWATVHGLAQLLLDGVVGVEILPQGILPDAPHTCSRGGYVFGHFLVAGKTGSSVEEQQNADGVSSPKWLFLRLAARQALLLSAPTDRENRGGKHTKRASQPAPERRDGLSFPLLTSSVSFIFS